MKKIKEKKVGSLFFNNKEAYPILKFVEPERTRIFLINNASDFPFVVVSIIISGELRNVHFEYKNTCKKMPLPLEKEDIYNSYLTKEEFNKMADILAKDYKEGTKLVSELDFSLLFFEAKGLVI